MVSGDGRSGDRRRSRDSDGATRSRAGGGAWPDAADRLRHGMRVAIVGAGFSGIGMGAALQRAGHEYAIFERADDLGGVWQHNTYRSEERRVGKECLE